ncbi:hypothetical protein LXM63_11785 [Chryseobacterium gleum]|uniref:hypothetical protein n=1 Tax=Chryseobacterium gleum TaxID=250 RepID=UPI001E4EBB58|nr:hypothetical protein [Chryseobacterium gleum]MCE4065777.1 hypothetical protein [Chryseobacterium gleum]
MILTDNQTTEIKRAIIFALTKLYNQDISLIERQAHERSSVFRFGLYFSEIIAQTSFGADNELTIDFDYNRNGENIKDMAGFNPKHGIFPDIVLHHRGFNDKNIVVIEFKGHWSGKGRDDEKLKGFTSEIVNDYHYGLGVFVRLTTTLTNCEITYYKNGELENV